MMTKFLSVGQVMTTALALAVAGGAALRVGAEETADTCRGYTMSPPSIEERGRKYSVVMDKTCRFSEGRGAAMSYGVVGDAAPFPKYLLDSSLAPEGREAMERAISLRLRCSRFLEGKSSDFGRIRGEVIPLIESDDVAGARGKLMEILLAPLPECGLN
jgi:hypothetical protein